MLLFADIPTLMQHCSTIEKLYKLTLSINSFALYVPPVPPKPKSIVSVKRFNTVLASNIAEKLSDQLLNMFFKSKQKSGGGEFGQPMDIDRRTGKALIFYKSSEGK